MHASDAAGWGGLPPVLAPAQRRSLFASDVLTNHGSVGQSTFVLDGPGKTARVFQYICLVVSFLLFLGYAVKVRARPRRRPHGVAIKPPRAAVVVTV